FIMAKMKILTKGKMLWSRTIGSTVFGQLVDSFIFYVIAFYGVWQNSDILRLTASAIFLKVTWEVILTPVTYLIVGKLKKVENEDYYDHDTNFNPFTIKT
ncbi:MAG: VUT family protein, partial [Proteobacteria bacterium]|nr:VUT family protein [Pseudomonadota bacterium]